VSDDPIDAYLATLERGLRGRPNRDRVLAETEDHLRESVEHLERTGLSPDAAARQAVGRMGAAEPLGQAAGGRVAAAAVLALGWIGAIGLIAAAAAVKGPGQDGPTPGLPLLLLVGAMAAGVVSLLAAAAVRSWSSAIASADAVLRRAMAAFAAAAAFALVGLGVHVGKHQSGGTIEAREQRALFCLAVAALVLLVALAWIELNARDERRKRSGPPVR
jgi:hypothetical protein